MVATLYSDILQRSGRSGKYNGTEMRDWLRYQAGKVIDRRKSPTAVVQASLANAVALPGIGKMTMFVYDPKHKETLPYYDIFPCVFPIKYYDDGILGINLHYLPPVYRARLMDNLHDLVSNKRYDAKTRLQISYNILNGAAKFRYFKPAIKRYLYSHVRSKFIEVNPQEWDYVMFLPLARFRKATQKDVWEESVQMIRGL